MKLLHIIGARPQFIKYFSVQEALYKRFADGPGENCLVHSGQHYDYRLSEIFFAELGIEKPAYHLEVGSGAQGEQTALVMTRAEEVLRKEHPEIVVVYGDTNTTLGAALAAAKLHLPVAHIEAGLRSRNKGMPEEINRVLVDHLATFLFCPSAVAVDNLRKENIGCKTYGSDENNDAGGMGKEEIILRRRDGAAVDIDNPLVVQVGDVMYDTLLHTLRLARERSSILAEMGLEEKGYVLLTVHRAENTAGLEVLEKIVAYVNEATAGEEVILPMHPRLGKLYKDLKKGFSPHVKIIEPVGYFDLLRLLAGARLLFTDSGGMQKEAYWLKIPCVTLREETEWVETIASGWNILYRDYEGFHRPRTGEVNAYGDGHAAEKIIDILFKG